MDKWPTPEEISAAIDRGLDPYAQYSEDELLDLIIKTDPLEVSTGQALGVAYRVARILALRLKSENYPKSTER